MKGLRSHVDARRRAYHRSSEDGQFLAMTVVFMTMFLALLGLVADGGHYLDAKQAAAADAEQAARAGASSFDTAGLYSGQITLDPATATSAAVNFWASTGQPGSPVVSVNGNTVTVGVSYSVPTQLLDLFGVPSMKIQVNESATAIGGVSTEG